MQRLWRENVSASARATDVTYGRNGWHAHLHVLLRTEGFDDDARAELLSRWQDAVRLALGADAVPDESHAIRWSTPIDACRADEAERARYLVKLGSELVGGETKDRTKRKSRTPWQLLADAIAGDVESRRLWSEYYVGMKGARAVELDDRCARFAREGVLHAALGVDAAEPLVDGGKTTVTIPVDSAAFRALRAYEQRFDGAILATIVADASKAQRPEEVVRAWLRFVAAKVARSSLWYEDERPSWYSRYGPAPPLEHPP